MMSKFLYLLLFVLSFPAFSKTVVIHPLFSTPIDHVANATIINREFDGYKLDSSLSCGGSRCMPNPELGFDAKGYLSIEGKINETRYSRVDGGEISDLLIFRNYQNAIQQLGGKRISDEKKEGLNLFLISKDNSKIWILLNLNDRDNYYLTIVESTVARQIVVAGQLADQIKKQGFANLNVNFDTNKSNIKDGDKAAINEVVTLLKNDSKLRLSVEGHTDNVGAAGANKSLSQARSDSLVAYMVSAGVPANRLVAKGFGSEVPVADNRNEECKAKNRRVELVKIK